jgi:hypothetical protein
MAFIKTPDKEERERRRIEVASKSSVHRIAGVIGVSGAQSFSQEVYYD